MEKDIHVGSEIAGYRVTGLVGQGGMGTVYLAEVTDDTEEVALKILSPELAGGEEFRRRFLREARYARSLDHPNVVAVRDSGEADGLLYMAMQYVQGTDLQALLALHGALPLERACEILVQVADALDAAHARGLLHRDVKPGNVLIASGAGPDEPGHCYLTDFGLSKNPATDSAALTSAGDFVGTLYYSAPEQITIGDVDHRADVYSAGCVLYEMLTGKPPFLRGSDAELLEAHVRDPPPRPTAARPDLPASLDDVVARAMSKDPAARYTSCGEMTEALRAALPAGVGRAARPARSQAAADSPDGKSADLRLTVTGGPRAGTELRVGHELLIGRHADGVGQFGGDDQLSRRHARIARTPDGGYAVEDLGSRNGTTVNGSAIGPPRPLRAGDTIALGQTTLVVAPDQAAAAPAATARLSLRLSLDLAAGQAELWVGDDPKPVRLVHTGRAWQVSDD